MRTLHGVVLVAALSCTVPAATAAQDRPAPPAAVPAVAPDQVPAPPPSAPVPVKGYTPATLRDRLDWAVSMTVGPTGWAARCLSVTWFTSWNSPYEWGQDVSGIGKRAVDHLGSAAVSNGLEAGLGALWGEDPRYPRLGGRRKRARIANVFNDLFTAPYADGRRRFAYARLVAAFGNNAIESLWLPPSTNEWKNTFLRTGYAYLAHLAGDAFAEFWPDLRRWLGRKLRPRPPVTARSPVEPQNLQKIRGLAIDDAIRVLDRSLTLW